VRERWFGATGRRVPEIAVEGELELDDALVLDDATDTERLHEAHEAGRPIVVRARSASRSRRRSPIRRSQRRWSRRIAATCSTSTSVS
jgi:hypothetical protein